MKFSIATVRSRIRLRQTKRERRFQSCSPMGFTRYGKSKPQKGIIRLQKADKEAEQEKKSPYASLKGAEYTVSSKEGTVLQTLVTDDEGKAESKPLLTGKYQVKETKAPEGYNIDSTIYQVELLPGEETAEIFYQSVSSKEEIIRGDFEIMKLAENENEDEDTLQGLAGAEFTVYEKTSGKEVIKLVTDERGFATTVSKEYPRGRLIFGTYVVKRRHQRGIVQSDHLKLRSRRKR